jgi:hypothetical protein
LGTTKDFPPADVSRVRRFFFPIVTPGSEQALREAHRAQCAFPPEQRAQFLEFSIGRVRSTPASEPCFRNFKLTALNCQQRQVVKGVDRPRQQAEKSTGASAALAEIPVRQRQARAESHDFHVIAVRAANVLTEPRREDASGFVRQSAVEVRAREFDRVETIDVDPRTIERPLREFFREDFAGFCAFSACEPNERSFVHKPRKILREPSADLGVPRRAHQILAASHGAGEKEMEARIRGFRARELFQDLRCFGVAPGSEMDARRFERDRGLDTAATELFREERRRFFRAVGETQDARELNTSTDQRWPFRNRAAVAMFGALQIAARELAARDFEM